MELEDGTKIEVVEISAKKVRGITNNKNLSDFDKGVHMLAAMILVNGQEVIYDDLMDCFTYKELEKILKFANPEDEKKD